ncbi:MAG: hypothetical protein IJL91_07065 [Bacteroidales bacterium]|nr:hypothetical protein [Bacteroidales bacterium]
MDPVISQLVGMFITGLASVLVALISSNGFWNRIEKKNGIKDSISKITEQQESLSRKIDENEAKGARRRILRFSDELTQQVRHTKDYFDDVLADIDLYERYCEENPKFPNNRTLMAETNIKATYQQCLAEHDFL